MHIMKKFLKHKNFLFFSFCLSLVSVAWAQSEEQKNGHWYWQGSLHQTGATASDVTLNMGGGVLLKGPQKLNAGTGASMVLGRQFMGEPDEAQNRRVWRLEAEVWSASLPRPSLTVAPLSLTPRDKLQAEALFVNAALRLGESDARYEGTDTPVWRSWLVGGVGAAHVSVPQPRDTPTGCGCFGAASASGAAYQLKLVLERQISQNGWLAHLQLAHVWLPSISTAAASLPQTHYGRFDTGTVSIGIRKLFD